MNKIIVTVLLFLAFAKGTAQIIKPVKWSTQVERISASEFNLIMNGKIDEGWHVYSQFTPEIGRASCRERV